MEQVRSGVVALCEAAFLLINATQNGFIINSFGQFFYNVTEPVLRPRPPADPGSAS